MWIAWPFKVSYWPPVIIKWGLCWPLYHPAAGDPGYILYQCMDRGSVGKFWWFRSVVWIKQVLGNKTVTSECSMTEVKTGMFGYVVGMKHWLDEKNYACGRSALCGICSGEAFYVYSRWWKGPECSNVLSEWNVMNEKPRMLRCLILSMQSRGESLDVWVRDVDEVDLWLESSESYRDVVWIEQGYGDKGLFI